ncbi:hypothetical protein PanNE5_14180 [Pandoraea sp. NE5]|nr:hypothetical protein PanNE5_14180 [Pandoraea sp. NE5]
MIEAMRTLSRHHPRFGSRRVRVLLRRKGVDIGRDQCTWLWAKAGLQVPKKRRIAGSRPRPYAPAARNSVWCYDFVFDACANDGSPPFVQWNCSRGIVFDIQQPDNPSCQVNLRPSDLVASACCY